MSALLSGFDHRRRALRYAAGIGYHPATKLFPLLYSNNLLCKMRRSPDFFQGSKPFDKDHALPIRGSVTTDLNPPHKFTDWELRLNPQLLNGHGQVLVNPQYIMGTGGRLIPVLGWIKTGGTWKYSRPFTAQLYRKNMYFGEWQERGRTPEWKRVPKIAAVGLQTRYEGKLEYVPVSLAKIMWFVEIGRLNPNEVITLHALIRTGVLNERDLVWPGVSLFAGGVTDAKIPIHLELQRASKDAIEAVERAGGTFTATYLSPEGIYQELHPEEFPTFLDQHLPDQQSFATVSSKPQERGFLARWHEDVAKYAHPDAGRRASHYVRPPHSRDFPATFEEYERVKHHQKWHLGQPGTGTELPFVQEGTADHARPTTGAL